MSENLFVSVFDVADIIKKVGELPTHLQLFTMLV